MFDTVFSITVGVVAMLFAICWVADDGKGH